MNIGYKVGELIYDEILELCCGTGRLTIPIAKDGYNENSEKQIYVLTLNDNKVLYEKIQNQR